MSKFNTLLEQVFKGIAQGKSLKDIADKHKVSMEEIQKQLDMGTTVEMEHTKDKELAKKIAMDHLFEIPDYYSKLNKIEKK